MNSDALHEEDSLVARAVEGEREAFNLLAEKHAKMVYNLCLKFLKSPEDAQDCTQEAFIRAYTAMFKFRMDSSFSTWICRIALNICKNHVSSSYSRHAKRTDSIENNASRAYFAVSQGKDRMPDEELLYAEKKELINAAINELSPDLRMLVVLRDMENRSYKEIEQITGQKPGTLKSRLSRARNILRDALRGKL